VFFFLFKQKKKFIFNSKKKMSDAFNRLFNRSMVPNTPSSSRKTPAMEMDDQEYSPVSVTSGYGGRGNNVGMAMTRMKRNNYMPSSLSSSSASNSMLEYNGNNVFEDVDERDGLDGLDEFDLDNAAVQQVRENALNNIDQVDQVDQVDQMMPMDGEIQFNNQIMAEEEDEEAAPENQYCFY
jgi:hypothetical protein